MIVSILSIEKTKDLSFRRFTPSTPSMPGSVLETIAGHPGVPADVAFQVALHALVARSKLFESARLTGSIAGSTSRGFLTLVGNWKNPVFKWNGTRGEFPFRLQKGVG